MSQRDWSDAHLVDAARDVHRDDPVFGYRFICDELAAEHGVKASENRVQRLCSAHGIYSVLAKKRGRWARPKEPVHDDLCGGSSAPRQPTSCGLPISPSTRPPKASSISAPPKMPSPVASSAIRFDSRMKASLAVAALNNAIALRGPVGTIVHSDRGSQFRSGKFLEALRSAGLVGSMGANWRVCRQRRHGVLLRPGAEQRLQPAALADARLAIVLWIERTYHRRRRQRALGKLTPVEFEGVNEVAYAA